MIIMSQPDDSQELDGSDDAALAFLSQHREQQEQKQQPPARQPLRQAQEEEEEQEELQETEEQDESGEQEASTDIELEFELDGKPVKIKQSELPTLYRERMLEKDYRQKTAEIAEAKRLAQADRERVQQERSHYASHLDVVLGSLQAQLIGDQQSLAQLAQTDPAAWVAENAKFQQRYAQYTQAVNERQQLANRMSAEQEQSDLEWRDSERKALQDKLPEWRDAKVQETESREIAEYLLSEGYATDELKELFDHRALLVARKAAKWDAHVKAQKSIKDKQARHEPPKTLKPGTANGNQQSANGAKVIEAANRARKTGSDDDLAAYLAAKRQNAARR